MTKGGAFVDGAKCSFLTGRNFHEIEISPIAAVMRRASVFARANAVGVRVEGVSSASVSIGVLGADGGNLV